MPASSSAAFSRPAKSGSRAPDGKSFQATSSGALPIEASDGHADKGPFRRRAHVDQDGSAVACEITPGVDAR